MSTAQLLLLLAYPFAVARVTRLINADTITDWLRLWPARKVSAARKGMENAVLRGNQADADSFGFRVRKWNTLYEFLGCPWCIGMWAALATAWVPLYGSDVAVLQYITIALAVSHLIGVFARFADTDDMEIVDDQG